MIVEHFLKWNSSALVAQRTAAASALARAYIGHELDFDDRCAAEAALTLLLDDPSEKVRYALAETISMSARAPAQIVAALASDQPEVAGIVLARSPLLTDADLIDRVAEGDERLQVFVAMRPAVSMSLSAAIAEVGSVEACLELMSNRGAAIASLSFRRMVERHGDRAELRKAMLADRRVPTDVRHMLVVRVGDALSASPFVRSLVGERRAERIARDACARSVLTMIDGTPSTEHGALVEHLRLRGDLTTSFIVRAVAYGKIDFLGAALTALTGQAEARIRALLTNGRESAMNALFRAGGLPEATHALLFRAISLWRDVANGRRIAGPQEVTFEMLGQVSADRTAGPQAELATLLRTIHLDTLRENARDHALAIAAA